MIAIISKLKTFILNHKVKREGGEAFSKTLREFYSSMHNIHVGYGSYGGCFNSTNIASGTFFGNYCSIAQDVKVFRANHPLDHFTLHPLFYNPIFGYVKDDQLHRPELYIGHDVWIGSSAIILPSVMTIGNGAVIGAGSVVTKDVPPYSVVVGNPARIIKMRFSEGQIKELEASKWWNWKKDELIKNKEAIESIVNEN